MCYELSVAHCISSFLRALSCDHQQTERIYVKNVTSSEVIKIHGRVINIPATFLDGSRFKTLPIIFVVFVIRAVWVVECWLKTDHQYFIHELP
jgi:hypothetical protein